VEDRTAGINEEYDAYAGKIRGLDNTRKEWAGFMAAKGVRSWADNYRNKSLAYLAELETALTRTNGSRLAALGTNTKTEPDMFTLRHGESEAEEEEGGVAVEETKEFGYKDHTEVKRTEGDETQIKKMVRAATHQLIARKDAMARRYLVETFAPNWYPKSDEREAMGLWAQLWAQERVEALKTANPFAKGWLVIRIYYAQATVPVTASVEIPHGR
jgi:hypothetical protein